MFMGLNKGLHEGDTISVTLDFERAGQIEVSFPVQAIGARGPAGAEPPGDGMGDGHEHGASK
jgi:copper(I)-binding protein